VAGVGPWLWGFRLPLSASCLLGSIAVFTTPGTAYCPHHPQGFGTLVQAAELLLAPHRRRLIVRAAPSRWL
jgi:hypothetical protein